MNRCMIYAVMCHSTCFTPQRRENIARSKGSLTDLCVASDAW